MGQIIFVLLVVGGLGLFFYRQMTAGTPHSGAACPPGDSSESGVEESTAPTGGTPSRSDGAEPDALETQIVALVTRTPGILQTDIYSKFPHENRKNLQAVLLQMDKDGALRREREGSTYRIFVV